MASEPTTNRSPVAVQPRKVWFGVIASATAWFVTGIAEMFITWRACLHTEQFGNASSHPAETVASFVISWLLIGIAASGGFLSYTAWRRMSSQRNLLHAEGHMPYEFVALAGIFVSFTLGVGMVWMAIPLFILRLCARIR
jgi:hypothetical protein